MSLEYDDPQPQKSAAHRVLWVITWILFALGMLEWFVLGANRPVDPVVSSVVGVVTLVATLVR